MTLNMWLVSPAGSGRNLRAGRGRGQWDIWAGVQGAARLFSLHTDAFTEDSSFFFLFISTFNMTVRQPLITGPCKCVLASDSEHLRGNFQTTADLLK